MSAASSLVALVGPTASGKTAAALGLARALGAEILSCDSLAVYRGCDIGSAKPSVAERAQVPHHLVDIVDPDQPFTAAAYVRHADRAIEEIAGRGRPVLLAGGTGLYLRALVEGLFPSPPPDAEFRARLKQEAEQLGWPALHARLAAIDPRAAGRIAPQDRVRIERALEVHAQTGEPLSVLQERHRGAPRYRVLPFVLDPGMPELERRIERRVAAMLDEGLVEEARRLAERFGRTAKPLGALGYRESLDFLDGSLSADQLAPAISAATRQLARRQRTWFARYQGGPRGGGGWISRAEDLPLDRINAFLGGRS